MKTVVLNTTSSLEHHFVILSGAKNLVEILRFAQDDKVAAAASGMTT